MSSLELTRLEIMQQLRERRLTQKQAAAHLQISTRQVKRLWQAYQQQGAAGLVSRRRGKPSNHQLDPHVLQQALDLIQTHYQGFGPTLAHEKLVEVHQLRISDERVRQLMIAEHLWQPKRARRKRVYQIRERRACRGELVQLDGSDFAWFEERGPRCTLLVLVDDATGELLNLRFVPHESLFGYCQVVRPYFERIGKPLAFYSDKHGIFHLNHPRAVQGDGLTAFGRAMQELDIQLICANTPQAKGRVERANQTLQDRLPKELRLRGISTPEAGNAYLPKFIADYNHRFGVQPRSTHDAHRPLAPTDDLARILTRRETRLLSESLSFQYHKVIYQIQIQRPGYALRGAAVTVCENEHAQIQVLYKGQPVPYQVVVRQPRQAEVVPAKLLDQAIRQPVRPAADHPWRKPFLPGSLTFEESGGNVGGALPVHISTAPTTTAMPAPPPGDISTLSH